MASATEIPPRLFDLALLRRRQKRAIDLGAELFLADRVAEDMSERLDVVTRKFVGVGDIGSPGSAYKDPSRDKFDSTWTYPDLPESDDEPLVLAVT